MLPAQHIIVSVSDTAREDSVYAPAANPDAIKLQAITANKRRIADLMMPVAYKSSTLQLQLAVVRKIQATFKPNLQNICSCRWALQNGLICSQSRLPSERSQTQQVNRNLLVC